MFISVWQELLITRLAKQSRYRVIPDPARVHSLAYQLQVALKKGSPLYRLPLEELRTGIGPDNLDKQEEISDHVETTTEERRNGEETFKYKVVKSLMEHAKMPRMEW